MARAAAAVEESKFTNLSKLEDDEQGVPLPAIARFLHPTAVDARYAEANWHSDWLLSLLDEIEDTAVQA